MLNRRNFLRRPLALLCAAPLASYAGLTHQPRASLDDFYVGVRFICTIDGKQQVRRVVKYDQMTKVASVNDKMKIGDVDIFVVVPTHA